MEPGRIEAGDGSGNGDAMSNHQTHNKHRCAAGCGRYVSDRAVIARTIYEYAKVREALIDDPTDVCGTVAHVQDRLNRELNILHCENCSRELFAGMPPEVMASYEREMQTVSILGEPRL